jgi:hypothetical protein
MPATDKEQPTNRLERTLAQVVRTAGQLAQAQGRGGSTAYAEQEALTYSLLSWCEKAAECAIARRLPQPTRHYTARVSATNRAGAQIAEEEQHFASRKQAKQWAAFWIKERQAAATRNDDFADTDGDLSSSVTTEWHYPRLSPVAPLR